MRVRNEAQKGMRKHLKRMLKEVNAAEITELEIRHETGWHVEDSGVRSWQDTRNRTLTIHYRMRKVDE